MERMRSWEKITATGKKIASEWEKIAKHNNIKIKIFGLPAIIKFSFENKNALAYKTLITQEMLKKGYLSANSVYVCVDHDQELDGYFEALNSVFSLIEKCENGLDVFSLLDGPICHSDFQRLN